MTIETKCFFSVTLATLVAPASYCHIVVLFSSVPPLRSCMVIVVSCSPTLTVMRCWSGLLATVRRIMLGQVVQPHKMSCWKKVFVNTLLTGTSFQHMLSSPLLHTMHGVILYFFTRSRCQLNHSSTPTHT